MKARFYSLTASGCSSANLFESLSFEKKVLKPREPMGHSVLARPSREAFPKSSHEGTRSLVHLSPKWARLHLHPIEEPDALSTLYWSFRHVEAKSDRVIEACTKVLENSKSQRTCSRVRFLTRSS